MKYAELKADNERLRTQLADLVNAVAALREEMLKSDEMLVYWADRLAAIVKKGEVNR